MNKTDFVAKGIEFLLMNWSPEQVIAAVTAIIGPCITALIGFCVSHVRGIGKSLSDIQRTFAAMEERQKTNRKTLRDHEQRLRSIEGLKHKEVNDDDDD